MRIGVEVFCERRFHCVLWKVPRNVMLNCSLNLPTPNTHLLLFWKIFDVATLIDFEPQHDGLLATATRRTMKNELESKGIDWNLH